MEAQPFTFDLCEKSRPKAYILYFPSFFLVSKEHFAKLSPIVQTVLSQTAESMQDWVLDTAEKLEGEIVARLRTSMTINEVDPLAFTIESLKIYQQYAKTSPTCKSLIYTVYTLTPKR